MHPEVSPVLWTFWAGEYGFGEDTFLKSDTNMDIHLLEPSIEPGRFLPQLKVLYEYHINYVEGEKHLLVSFTVLTLYGRVFFYYL
jgi:hypothetical protein